MLTTSARLLQLLTLLQARSSWTGPELAARLQVTVRSVRRDVDRLRTLGYPVESLPGRAGGYRMGPGTELPPLQFDDEQAVAVWAALAAAAGGAVPGFETDALGALAVLDRLLPERLRRRTAALRGATVRLRAAAGEPVAPRLLLTLATCCTAGERLRIAYVDREGRRSERRVDPHRLVAAGRRWYLVGLDVDRRAWRTLRVDRIEDAVATGHHAELVDPPDAAALVAEATTAAPYRHTATVVIDAPLDVVRARVPATVATLDVAPGGRTRLVSGSDSLAALAGHLVGLDLPFEVVDPPELRDHLRAVGVALVAAHRG